jgi:hypothetical protein
MIKICTLLFTFSGILLYSQVGINTQSPSGIFHVDAAKDNPSTGIPNATQQTNDFIITNDGKVGIGNISPTSKLEVDGSSTNKSAYNAGSSNIIDFFKE